MSFSDIFDTLPRNRQFIFHTNMDYLWIKFPNTSIHQGGNLTVNPKLLTKRVDPDAEDHYKYFCIS